MEWGESVGVCGFVCVDGAYGVKLQCRSSLKEQWTYLVIVASLDTSLLQGY